MTLINYITTIIKFLIIGSVGLRRLNYVMLFVAIGWLFGWLAR